MSKLLKRLCSILLLSCFSFVLVSCVGSSPLLYGYDKKISSVELINYDNPQAKENPSEKYDLDVERIEVLETFDLDSPEFEDFLVEINIRVHMKMNRKQFLFSHDGKGLRIEYEDGDFQIITFTEIDSNHYFFVGMYSEDGTVTASKDISMVSATEEFKKVINKYFTTQI